MELNQIIEGDALTVLKTMPDKLVQCVVTSPPYWGLRDYGTAEWEGGDSGCDHTIPVDSGISTNKGNSQTHPGCFNKKVCDTCGAIRIDNQLGLESTPEEYVAKMVEIFAEVRRVLRDDGVLFLNLGDSYMGSGGAHKEYHENPGLSKSFERGGVPHAGAYDISGKEPEGSRDRGCLCENLCDVCREVYQIHRFHNDGLLVSMLTVSLSLPSREYKELQNAHSPTWNFSLLENHILNAIRDCGHISNLSDEQRSASLESMPDEFSRQLLAGCWQRGNSSFCLLCGRSLNDDAVLSEHKKVCTCDIEKRSDALSLNKSGTFSSDLAYPYLTNTFQNVKLKQKDLCGIPWRVAFALQADGWYLRQDIIWAKPNPMPESVTDRCTKSHEYIFLLTKKAKYYMDMDAIREPSTGQDGMAANFKRESKESDVPGQSKQQHRIDREPTSDNGSRNRRSVWIIVTQPFPPEIKDMGQHFATFPEKLVEPCILAGSNDRACGTCGAAWEREVNIERPADYDPSVVDPLSAEHHRKASGQAGTQRPLTKMFKDSLGTSRQTLGFRPTCEHDNGDSRSIILDPFMGSGTVALVALKLGRDYIGIELKRSYIAMAMKRLKPLGNRPLPQQEVMKV